MKDLMADMEAYVNQETSSPTNVSSSPVQSTMVKPSLVEEMDKHYGSAPTTNTQQQTTDSGVFSSKTAESAVAGFNRAVDVPVQGAVQLVARGIDALAGTHLTSGINDYITDKSAEYENITKDNKVAAAAGNLVGQLGLAVATPMKGNYVTQGAKFGAVYGALTPSDSIAGNLTNAAVGGAVGAVAGAATGAVVGGLRGLARIAQRVKTGGEIATIDATKAADLAMKTNLKEGQTLTDTAASFRSNMNTVYQDIKTYKTKLYSDLDSVVKESDVTIPRTATKEFVSKIQSLDDQVGTVDNKAVLAEAEALLKNPDKDVPMSLLWSAQQRLNKKASSAFKKGDVTIGEDLKALSSAIGEDIRTGLESKGRSDIVNALEYANKYNAETFAPLHDVANKLKALDRFSEAKYLSTVTSRIKNEQGYAAKLETQVPGSVAQAERATINTLKDATTHNGDLDLVAYSNGLDNLAVKNPYLFGDHAKAIRGIADALKITGEAKSLSLSADPVKGATQLARGASIANDVGVGRSVPVVGNYISNSRAAKLYAAGKMIEDPTSRELIQQFTNIKIRTPDSPIVTALANTVNKTYSGYIRTYMTNQQQIREGKK